VSALDAELKKALLRGWGYRSFRPLQKEAVQAALAGKDTLVVLPTGGGKSVCYQLPAALGKGLVLVVSPLIALMDDQVAAAREAGLKAEALHSNLEGSRRSEAYRLLASGQVDLLYVSPERLLVGDLAEELAPRLVLIAVDEAHCVSHWGHEFRPEYRRLAEVFERLPKAARMALTATATPEVREDICRQLALREPERFIGHPDRPNLVYRAVPRHDQAAQVLDVIRRHPKQGGIVYAQTRKEVDRLAEGLREAGVSCVPYHAGMEASERRECQEKFLAEDADVVVATIAFGMGIDRPDVRFVVHANTPRSVEHYQQESGRAGRDGESAECVLLFAASDLIRHRFLAKKDGELAPERERALEKQLREIGRYAAAPVCRHGILSEHFGAEYPAPAKGCGACDVCLGETRSLPDEEALLTAKKILSAAWRTEGRFGAGYVVKLLLGKPDERMASRGHDKLGVFGLLGKESEAALRYWVDQLIVQGFLEVDEGDYPLLRITSEGKALCADKGTVRLGTAVPQARKRKGRKPARPTMEAEPRADEALFERLRAFRRMIALQLGVPPYVVFHDAALLEMAALRPRTLEELRLVKGVGEKKLERFGPAFLKVIAGGSGDA